MLAFDVQEDAVRQTRALLEQEGLSAEVVLDSHANMGCYAAPESVDCIVFNFGRLPGGDPKIFTYGGVLHPCDRRGACAAAPGRRDGSRTVLRQRKRI